MFMKLFMLFVNFFLSSNFLDSVKKIPFESTLASNVGMKTRKFTFNPYRFADYKQKVIYLLLHVCRVSVEMIQIIKKL
jgi:hypothetical protein